MSEQPETTEIATTKSNDAKEMMTVISSMLGPFFAAQAEASKTQAHAHVESSKIHAHAQVEIARINAETERMTSRQVLYVQAAALLIALALMCWGLFTGNTELVKLAGSGLAGIGIGYGMTKRK